MKFFRIPFNQDEDSGTTEVRPNRLQKYIHAQSVQDMSRMASELSPDVRQLIGANVQALLGYLPAGEFNTSIMASKESMQNLLASAMLTGFFMHAMETRMHMDEIFEGRLEGQEAEPRLPDPRPELQSPENLFQAESRPEADIPEPLPEPQAGIEAGGRFLSSEELAAEAESGHAVEIQLEINTRMNRAELSRLLRELREFQARAESDGEPDLG